MGDRKVAAWLEDAAEACEEIGENELVAAGAPHYRLAARRLAKMRTLAAGSIEVAAVEHLVAELRRTHRRRLRLQQEFDRAGLPR